MTDLQREIARLGPWFHNLHLPDGTQTCPEHELGDFPRFKWLQIASCLPPDLHGATALDLGCNAGFYSFELARRGARVTALDIDEHYLAQARWAAERLGLHQRISFRRGHLYELAGGDRRWDIVLFMGLLYHLRYPLLGLDIVSRRVGRLLVFQCLSMPGPERSAVPPDLGLSERELLAEPAWPKLAFIEHELARDRTNWWAPNPTCIEAMLRSSGMRVSARPGPEIYVCEPDPGGTSNMWRWNEDEYWAAVGRRRGAGTAEHDEWNGG